MKLCLVEGAQTDIPWRVIRYPDGQRDIVLTGPVPNELVEISSRMNSFADLELILCATSALVVAGARQVALRSPYLLGARSDRVFQAGGSNYLRDVIAPILNSQHYRYVRVLDPHSAAGMYEIRNATNEAIYDFLAFAFKSLAVDRPALICPDKGAAERVKYAARLSCPDIVTCDKEREPSTGKILRTIVPREDFGGRDVVVIDDICDGGRTFTEIAKALEGRNVGRKFLIVTHAIFSAGVEAVSAHFDKIVCTNSVKDVKHDAVIQFSLF